MGWSVAMVVRRATGRPWDRHGLLLLLLGIAAAYSLDRVADRDRAQAPWVRRAIAVAAGAAVIAGLALLPGVATSALVLATVAGAASVLYPWWKRLPAAKTVVVPLVWTWCGIALPLGETSALGWHGLREPVALPIFLLFAAGCVLCDLKDAARDRSSGVPSMPALLGPAAAARVAVGLAVLGGLAAVIVGRPALAWSAVALSSLSLSPAVVAVDDVGPLLVDVALTLPGILIAAHLV